MQKQLGVPTVKGAEGCNMCRSHRLPTGIQNSAVDLLATYTPPAPSQVLTGGSELIRTNLEHCVLEVPSWECQRFVVIPALLLVEDSHLSAYINQAAIS
jgi:hypothetical protein